MKVKEFTKLLDTSIGGYDSELYEPLKVYYTIARLVKLLEDHLRKLEGVFFSLPISPERLRVDIEFGDDLYQMPTFCGLQFYYDSSDLDIYFFEFNFQITIDLDTGKIFVSTGHKYTS